MPTFKARVNSPIETTSAPNPSLRISFNNTLLAFDFTEKQINGFTDLNIFLKELIFSFNLLYE